MDARTMRIAALVASLVGGAIGVWFWQQESDFAARNNNELASTLQWVGIALAVLGLAGVLLAGASLRDGER